MSGESTERPRVVSRAEWLRARRVVHLLEADAAHSTDEASAQRRRMPMVKMRDDYVFDGPNGVAALLDLFANQSRLVVHHIAWSEQREEVGSPCSGLIESREYGAQLDVMGCALAFVSRAPIGRLEAYRQRMEWCVPLYSSARTTFHYDFGATVDPSRGATTYNYRDVTRLGGLWSGFTGDLPGASVFRREGGEVYHHYSAYARGWRLGEQVLQFVDRRLPRLRDESTGDERSDAREHGLGESWTSRVESAMIAG
ncbi:MAG: DUF899 family protein [bacterium]